MNLTFNNLKRKGPPDTTNDAFSGSELLDDSVSAAEEEELLNIRAASGLSVVTKWLSVPRPPLSTKPSSSESSAPASPASTGKAKQEGDN